MAKVPYTFKLDIELLSRLKQLAEEDNRALNNYVEVVLKRHCDSELGPEKKSSKGRNTPTAR